MKILLGRYVCEQCASSFEAPILSEFSYGEFLLWSAGGSVAYLNTFEDGTYMDVKDLLLQRFGLLRSDDYEAATVLRRIFGPVACDPDAVGEPYRIGAQPPCPRCGSPRIASWNVIDPPKFVDWDIPVVTHFGWNRLSSSEKNAAVERAVATTP